jgi:hypothetical protein
VNVFGFCFVFVAVVVGFCCAWRLVFLARLLLCRWIVRLLTMSTCCVCSTGVSRLLLACITPKLVHLVTHLLLLLLLFALLPAPVGAAGASLRSQE